MSHRIPPSMDDADTLLPVEVPRWFILRIIGGRETGVLRALREILKPHGLVCYLPRETKWRRGYGPKARCRTALIPGYCFVQATSSVFHLIRHVEGVLGFLCHARAISDYTAPRPATVPQDFVGGLVVSELFGAFDGTRGEHKPAFGKGDAVKVKVGKYADFPGTVLKTSPEGRVTVLLTLFGRTHEKTVAEGDLKAA